MGLTSSPKKEDMMSKRLMIAGLGVLIAVFGIVAIACSDDSDDSDSTVASEAQLCNDIADLGQALAAFAALGPDSTVDDLKTARDGVVDAGEKVDESAEKVGEARVSDVDSAVSDLQQSVEDVSDDATITEAVGSVQTQVLAVDTAALQFFSDLNCAT